MIQRIENQRTSCLCQGFRPRSALFLLLAMTGLGAPCLGAATISLSPNPVPLSSGEAVVTVTDANANSALCIGAGVTGPTCTQGTIDCARYGYPGAGFRNDCDGNGRFEVEVIVTSLEEPRSERFRLEQTGVGSSTYTGKLLVSSSQDGSPDGAVYLQYRQQYAPTFRVHYLDQLDGAIGVGNGADAKPGFANKDDD